MSARMDLEKRRIYTIGIPLTLEEKQIVVKAALQRGIAPAVYARQMLLAVSKASP